MKNPNQLFSRNFYKVGPLVALAICNLGYATETETKTIHPVADAVFTHPSVYGATSCSTSGCHGGADEDSMQYVMWSQRDVHSRSYATLTTARSARMAEALKIENPATNISCTICHAPLQAVATTIPARLSSEARVTEGVSCASCHGEGGDWIRAHTRTDFSHAEKVAMGLKDLRDLRERANSCVACHQNIDPKLIEVGRHPRLIFELDGQTKSEPRHWIETAEYNGARAWFVGQAVALREMSWALANNHSADADLVRWRALLWVMQCAQSGSSESGKSGFAGISFVPSRANFQHAMAVSDQLASKASSDGNFAEAAIWLRKLASTADGFADTSVDRSEQAYRAERLVLALDRLLAAAPAEAKSAASSPQLDVLFKGVQSIPDFDPALFSRELIAFLKTLP